MIYRDKVYSFWRCALKKILIFFVLLMFFVPLTVRAQEAVPFQKLVVELWPEYDDPGVLVIYRGILSPQVTLPAQVTLTMPAEAGQPNAVAVKGAEDQLMSVQFERVVKGDTAEVSFTSTSEEIQFEYYDPGLEKNGAQRAYIYRWPGNHPVNSAIFQVQKPRGSSNVEISPAFGESFQGSDGLTYFRSGESSLELGQEKTIHVEYSKTAEGLSIGDQPVQPSTAVEPRISLSFQGRNLIPWILGGVGLILIVVAVGLYWRFGTQIGKAHKSGVGQQSGKQVLSDQSSYCPQCGSRTSENDRFCRVCGQRL